MTSRSTETVVGAIDIGGTKIAVGLVDSNGRILEQAVSPTEAERSLEDGLERMYQMVLTCQQRAGLEKLSGIGIGCTGPVDPETGILGPNSFMPLWEGQEIRQCLEARFALSVAIENDADAAALGEYTWGAGKGASRLIYVTVSTGIGCGVILDGRVYRGVNGAHPEMGHHVIDAMGGPDCICGSRGCWESLASGPGMAAWYNARTQARALEMDAPLDAYEICRRATAGEGLAREAVDREGFYLGVGLANLITLFTPDVIVLGGGMMGSWSLFKPRVRDVIRRNCGLVPHHLTELRLASLGARTGLAGAASIWFHRYENA